MVTKLISDPKIQEYLLEEDKNPSFAYIYYLIYGQTIVYIGQSVSLDSRIGSHKVSKEFDRVMYQKVPFKERKEIETKEIRKWFPIYNVSGFTPEDEELERFRNYLEFDKFFIFRKGGTVPKDKVMFNDNSYFWLDEHGYFAYEHKYNRASKTFTKRRIEVRGNRVEFSKVFNQFVVVNHSSPSPTPVLNHPVKQKPPPKSTKKEKALKHYVIPVGKYKGFELIKLKDKKYKEWYIKNVLPSQPKSLV